MSFELSTFSISSERFSDSFKNLEDKPNSVELEESMLFSLFDSGLKLRLENSKCLDYINKF